MTNPAAEINAFIDSAKKYAEPALKFQALSAKSFERFAKFGYELAGDYLHFGIAALHATSAAKDLPGLVKSHTELAQSQFEKQAQRSQDLVKLATSVQSEATQWFDEVSQPARSPKAAKAA
jgi:phasin family protein